MSAIHDCQAGRLAYIAARIADAEAEVRRLRKIIDQQFSDSPPIAETVSKLTGEIDELRSTLDRARTVCGALLAADNEAGR